MKMEINGGVSLNDSNEVFIGENMQILLDGYLGSAHEEKSVVKSIMADPQLSRTRIAVFRSFNSSVAVFSTSQSDSNINPLSFNAFVPIDISFEDWLKSPELPTNSQIQLRFQYCPIFTEISFEMALFLLVSLFQATAIPFPKGSNAFMAIVHNKVAKMRNRKVISNRNLMKLKHFN